jgi:predicted  nucleic acid-binding Zn-ribbon protein
MPALGQRVVQLEGQMQKHAGAIGGLERATDELRAETQALRGETQALRSDMRELRSEMDRRFERVDQRFDRMDQKIDRHFTWLTGMFVALLLGLLGLSLQISRLQAL